MKAKILKLDLFDDVAAILNQYGNILKFPEMHKNTQYSFVHTCITDFSIKIIHKSIVAGGLQIILFFFMLKWNHV